MENKCKQCYCDSRRQSDNCYSCKEVNNILNRDITSWTLNDQQFMGDQLTEDELYTYVEKSREVANRIDLIPYLLYLFNRRHHMNKINFRYVLIKHRKGYQYINDGIILTSWKNKPDVETISQYYCSDDNYFDYVLTKVESTIDWVISVRKVAVLKEV